MRIISEKSKERDRIRRRKEYDRGQAILRRYKKIKGCACCGYRAFSVALHFDHIIPRDKKFLVATKAHYLCYGKNTKSNKKIREEVFKCQILCANCHAIRTNTEEHYGVKRLARV